MIFDIDPIGNRTRLPGHRLSPLRLGAAALLLASVPASAETLMDAVEAAYANNPNLVQQRYQQKSTNETYVQQRTQYGPTLSVGATATDSFLRLHGQQSDTKTGNAFLTLNQEIYSGGRRRGAVAQAREDVLSSEEQLRRVEGQTIQQVIAAYTSVIRDQQKVDVGRENIVVLQRQLREKRAKRRVRAVTVTDVAQSDARLAAGEIQLAQAVAQLNVSRGVYLQIVGHEPGDLSPVPDLPGLPDSIDEAFAAADAGNANLTAARHAEEASRANIAAQRAGKRPTISIQTQAGKSGSLTPLDIRNYQTSATTRLTITQPLFQAGLISSRIRQAKDQANAAQAEVDIQHRQALQDVVAAWNQLMAARVAVTSGARQVETAQIAFAGMEREESYGLRATIEVLNAEQELAQAQLNLLSSRAQEYVSRGALLLAMGRLDARAVNSAIPAKDPDAEFKKVYRRGMLPTDPVFMVLDRVGSPSTKPKRKPDLRGETQPKPTGAPAMPPTPDRHYMEAPLKPITESPLVPADQVPPSVRPADPPPGAESPPPESPPR